MSTTNTSNPRSRSNPPQSGAAGSAATAGAASPAGSPGNVAVSRDEGGLAARERQAAEPTRIRPTYRPNVDVLETPTEVLILADVPGADPEGLDIRFENGLLTIHAGVPRRDEARGDELLREYGVGDFHRSFEVSEIVDGSRITADYVEGVLTIHLPKTEAAQPRRIAVRVAGADQAPRNERDERRGGPRDESAGRTPGEGRS